MNTQRKTILRITGVSLMVLGLCAACGGDTSAPETSNATPAAPAAPAASAPAAPPPQDSASESAPGGAAPADAPATATASGDTPPAAPAVKSTRYEDWVVNCPQTAGARSQCEAVQTLAVNERPIARIAVGRSPINDELAVAVNLPAAVALGTPVTLAGEGGADPQLVLTWRRCGPVGCFADGTPSPAVFAAWSAHAGAGRMAFQDFNDSPISIAYSFKGLDAAIKALSESP